MGWRTTAGSRLWSWWSQAHGKVFRSTHGLPYGAVAHVAIGPPVDKAAEQQQS
jgi:hypothetical protein